MVIILSKLFIAFIFFSPFSQLDEKLSSLIDIYFNNISFLSEVNTLLFDKVFVLKASINTSWLIL